MRLCYPLQLKNRTKKELSPGLGSCCLDREGEITLGNIFTQTPQEILSSPRAKAIVEGFSNRKPSEELCRRCGYATRFN